MEARPNRYIYRYNSYNLRLGDHFISGGREVVRGRILRNLLQERMS